MPAAEKTFSAAGALARGGEAFEAFEAFYQENRDRVRRVVFNIGGMEDLDDIVQDTFLRIWRAWDQYRGGADRRTWTYRAAVNTARDHWRKKGRRRATLADFLAQPRSPREDEGEAWHRRNQVATALAELPLAQRETVILVYLEELSLAEAARALDLPLGTVKSRLHSARGALAKILGET